MLSQSEVTEEMFSIFQSKNIKSISNPYKKQSICTLALSIQTNFKI